MRPEQAGQALDAEINKIKTAVDEDTIVLMQHAKRAATVVHRAALSAGDSINVRVAPHKDGVKVLVTGRQAGRYKTLLGQVMDDSMRDARNEIKARIVASRKAS